MTKKGKRMEDNTDELDDIKPRKEVKEDEIDYECEGKMYKILVGKSDQNNWDIIDKSSQNDIWFHVDNQSSCHVIIQTDGNLKVERNVIKEAASLCKNGSKARNSRKVPIIFTLVKNIKKGDKPGSVTARKTQTIVI